MSFDVRKDSNWINVSLNKKLFSENEYNSSLFNDNILNDNELFEGKFILNFEDELLIFDILLNIYDGFKVSFSGTVHLFLFSASVIFKWMYFSYSIWIVMFMFFISFIFFGFINWGHSSYSWKR